MEQYDHYRRGYNDQMFQQRLSSAGFNNIETGSYCRFFSEFIEMSLNAVYVFINKRKNKNRSAQNLSYRPTSGSDMQANKKIFALYKLVFPVLHFISQLDNLLSSTKGYVIYARASKPRIVMKQGQLF